MAASAEWHKLPLSLAELCIDTTLRCGQAFRWRKIGDEWHCTLYGRLITLRQDSTHLHYRTIWPKEPSLHKHIDMNGPRPSLTSFNPQHLGPPTPPASQCPSAFKNQQVPLSPSSSSSSLTPPPQEQCPNDTLLLLHRYFALPDPKNNPGGPSLVALYAHWSAKDPNFARRAPAFTGIRILNQDAWETLVAFICSSNNNIARIARMMGTLCDDYGARITILEDVEGSIGNEVVFHDFPAPEALIGGGVEERLRALGFGYRARYVVETARAVVKQSKELGMDWLSYLRNPESPSLWPTSKPSLSPPAHCPAYASAHAALLKLSGVGPKVADCVCLMGLGWHEAVPVDTHVWQIARRDYPSAFRGAPNPKTLTKGMYEVVGEHFRTVWGSRAGWAQSVLFTANLRAFRERAKSHKRAQDEDGEIQEVKEMVNVERGTEDVKMPEIDGNVGVRASKRIRTKASTKQ